MILEGIKARAEAATPGPWELAGGNEWLSPLGIDVGSEDESSRPTLSTKDAEFIAHARTDIPKLVAALEAVVAEHRKVSIYDECECPEGTHPEDYDYIDCQDYAGCENSITGIGCEECCVHGDYLTEACGESHNHTMDATQRCATVKAITEALA